MPGYQLYELKVLKTSMRLLRDIFTLVCEEMECIKYMKIMSMNHHFSSNVSGMCRFPTMERDLQEFTLWEGTCNSSY